MINPSQLRVVVGPWGPTSQRGGCPI